MHPIIALYNNLGIKPFFKAFFSQSIMQKLFWVSTLKMLSNSSMMGLGF